MCEELYRVEDVFFSVRMYISRKVSRQQTEPLNTWSYSWMVLAACSSAVAKKKRRNHMLNGNKRTILYTSVMVYMMTWYTTLLYGAWNLTLSCAVEKCVSWLSTQGNLAPKMGCRPFWGGSRRTKDNKRTVTFHLWTTTVSARFEKKPTSSKHIRLTL